LSSLVLSLLYCRVLTVLSCLVFQRLALKSLKKSMHLRRGSLRLREMYCALFHPSCLVSRVLYTSLSSIVLHFRSIRCIRGRNTRLVLSCLPHIYIYNIYSLAPPTHWMHPRQEHPSCLNVCHRLALPKHSMHPRWVQSRGIRCIGGGDDDTCPVLSCFVGLFGRVFHGRALPKHSIRRVLY
jgi:hypothetical protein